eukprot:6212013-Pleurochrysis_carterae.AAC.2
MMQIMHWCEEGGKIIKGFQSRRKGKVDKPWHRASRDRYCEDHRVDEGERVQSRGVEDRTEGCAVSPRQATSPQEELLT